MISAPSVFRIEGSTFPDGTYFSRNAVPLPQAPPQTALVADAALLAEIRAILGEDIDSYGVYVKDVATGRGVALNETRRFYAASLFKVEIMFEVFHHISLGLIDLDYEMELTDRYTTFALGSLPVEVGEKISVRDALVYMMSISDNVSANMLLDLVGAGNVNRSLATLGILNTAILSEDLPLTAADIARLLEAIWQGAGFSEEHKQQMIGLLLSEQIDNGLKAGVPLSVQVAHKTGNWADATNDAGIVFSPGSTYIIAILSDRGYETALIEQISEAVYDHFN